MAYVTGTATDYLDLLARLKTFVTTDATLVGLSQNWTLLGDATAADEVMTLQGPGLAGTDTIIVTLSPYQDAGADYYNWRLGGAISYDAGPPESWLGASPGGDDQAPRVLLRNGSMQYWFRADGRSISGVVKVSTVYQCFHLGLLLPYATPGQWPLPLVVGGMTTEQQMRFSDETDEHSAFWDPFRNGNEGSVYGALLVRDAGGNWLDFANRSGQAMSDERFVFPRRYSTTGPIVTKHLEPIGTCWPTDRFEVSTKTPTKNLLGALDGWLWTTGHGLAAEDVITVDGQDYLAVPNAFRNELDRWALMQLG